MNLEGRWTTRERGEQMGNWLFLFDKHVPKFQEWLLSEVMIPQQEQRHVARTVAWKNGLHVGTRSIKLHD